MFVLEALFFSSFLLVQEDLLPIRMRCIIKRREERERKRRREIFSLSLSLFRLQQEASLLELRDVFNHVVRYIHMTECYSFL